MRYGLKYGGVILVGTADQREAIVTEAFRRFGQYRERGDLVPGGYWNLIEPVNEDVLDTLREDYKVVEFD